MSVNRREIQLITLNLEEDLALKKNFQKRLAALHSLAFDIMCLQSCTEPIH